MSCGRAKMALVLVVAGFALSSQGALNITWGSGGSAGDIFNSSGTQLAGSAYAIQLILDRDNDTVVSDMITAMQFGIGSESLYGGMYDADLVDDDIVVNTSDRSWNLSSGAHVAGSEFLGSYFNYLDSTIDANSSDRFYFRWFNTATPGTATEVGIIYDTNWMTAASPSAQPQASANIDFDSKDASTLGTVNGTSGWKTVAPVPEPGSMVLFALGLVTLAVRRRRR